MALYHLAEVCLITSTRDGMNLVAYEYIASQRQKCGVLVLSEFAGAAQSLNGTSAECLQILTLRRIYFNQSLEHIRH